MAINKSKLETALNERSILLEEKRMWYRVGFYISAESAHDSQLRLFRTTLIDAAGNNVLLSPMVAENLRIAVIEWWQGEKLKPRAQEIGKTQTVGPYDELENRNST